MSLSRNSSRSGKKAGSAARNSIARNPAARKGGKALGNTIHKSSKKKKSKSSGTYTSLKAKQMAVEKLKRSIWAALQDIMAGVIRHASSGNVAAAKELFDFAGVYSLPTLDDEATAAPVALPAASPAAAPADAIATPPAAVHPIDAFFRKIGVEPSPPPRESQIA